KGNGHLLGLLASEGQLHKSVFVNVIRGTELAPQTYVIASHTPPTMSSAAPPHKPMRAPHHALSCTSYPVPRPNQRIMSLDTIPMKRSAPAPRSMASGNTLKLFVDAITPGLSTLRSRTSCPLP